MILLNLIIYLEINLMISWGDKLSFCKIISISDEKDFISSFVIFKDISFPFSVSIKFISLLVYSALFTLYFRDL